VRAVRFCKNSYFTRMAVPGMFIFYLLDSVVVFDMFFLIFIFCRWNTCVPAWVSNPRSQVRIFYVIDLFPFVSSFVWIFIRSFLQVNLIFVSCLGWKTFIKADTPCRGVCVFCILVDGYNNKGSFQKNERVLQEEGVLVCSRLTWHCRRPAE